MSRGWIMGFLGILLGAGIVGYLRAILDELPEIAAAARIDAAIEQDAVESRLEEAEAGWGGRR